MAGEKFADDECVRECKHDVPDVAAVSQTSSQLAHLESFKLWAVIVGLCMAMLLSGLDFTLLATAIPTISNEFNSVQDIGWYASTYIIAGAACIPLTGRLFRIFSAKWTYLGCMVIFEAGSIVCATAPNSIVLIVGRAITGIGAAGLFPGNIIVVSHVAPKRKQPTYTGIVTAFFGIATIIGPVIGGAFAQHTTWRWCFWINLPLGAVTITVITTFFNPHPHPDAKLPRAQKILRLDPVGFLLFASTIVMLLLAIQFGGGEYQFDSPIVIGLFCGAGLTFVVFTLWQWKQQESASIPPRIFRQRTMFFGSIAALLSMGATQIVVFYLPIWFQAVQAVSPTQSGVRYLATVVPNVLISFLGGAFVSHVGYFNPPFLFGCAMVAVGSGLLGVLHVDSDAGHWIGFQIIVGLGFGLIVQAPSIAAQVTLPLQDIAVGAAIMGAARFLGGSIWVSVAQSVFQSRLKKELASRLVDIDPDIVLSAGATGFRRLIPAPDLPQVLQAYNVAVTSTFYISATISAFAFFFVLGMDWTNVKKAK